jgi:hypothetical protein
MLSRHESDEIRYLQREAFEPERDAWEPLDYPEDGFPLDRLPAQPEQVGPDDGAYPF